MPRHVRINYARATYQVMCQGDRQEAIFWDEGDRKVRCDARRSQIATTLHAQAIIPLAWTTQALLMHTRSIVSQVANAVSNLEFLSRIFSRPFSFLPTLFLDPFPLGKAVQENYSLL